MANWSDITSWSYWLRHIPPTYPKFKLFFDHFNTFVVEILFLLTWSNTSHPVLGQPSHPATRRPGPEESWSHWCRRSGGDQPNISCASMKSTKICHVSPNPYVFVFENPPGDFFERLFQLHARWTLPAASRLLLQLLGFAHGGQQMIHHAIHADLAIWETRQGRCRRLRSAPEKRSMDLPVGYSYLCILYHLYINMLYIYIYVCIIILDGLYKIACILHFNTA